jgi:hypothetical protein
MTIAANLAQVLTFFSGRSIQWMRGPDDDQFAVGNDEKAIWKGHSKDWRRTMHIASIGKEDGRNKVWIEWGTPHRAVTSFHVGRAYVNGALELKSLVMLTELMRHNGSSTVTLLFQPEYNRIAFGVTGGDHQLSGYFPQAKEIRQYNGNTVSPMRASPQSEKRVGGVEF